MSIVPERYVAKEENGRATIYDEAADTVDKMGRWITNDWSIPVEEVQ